jgi:hypothetical protein
MATIPELSGLEVFVNQVGTITICQQSWAWMGTPPSSLDEEPIVVVHPHDVPALIRALERARREALRPEAAEPEEIAGPAIQRPRRSDAAS